jgi:hypothetical protein
MFCPSGSDTLLAKPSAVLSSFTLLVQLSKLPVTTTLLAPAYGLPEA